MENMVKNFSTERVIENYKQINANVAAFLDMKLENEFLSLNDTLDVIRHAMSTLTDNQLVVNGSTKIDYDKNTAIKQLSEALWHFKMAKFEISNAIDSLRLADDFDMDDAVLKKQKRNGESIF